MFREDFLQARLGVGKPEEEEEESHTELEQKLYEVPEHLKVREQMKVIRELFDQVKDFAEAEKNKTTWVTGIMQVPISVE